MIAELSVVWRMCVCLRLLVIFCFFPTTAPMRPAEAMRVVPGKRYRVQPPANGGSWSDLLLNLPCRGVKGCKLRQYNPQPKSRVALKDTFTRGEKKLDTEHEKEKKQPGWVS